MATSHPAACPETHRPPQSLSPARDGDDGGRQLLLAASIADAHRAGGDRLRALYRKAIELNRLSLVDLAEESGVDEKQIARCLRDDGGAHPPLAFVACLLNRDRLQVILTGLADMLGFELVPKKRDVEAENRQLRSELLEMREKIDAILGTQR